LYKKRTGDKAGTIKRMDIAVLKRSLTSMEAPLGATEIT
jgi:hypothetical protein